MHITYMIKINRAEYPNRYIGSKSNCTIEHGKILNKNLQEYVGSTKDESYKQIIKDHGYQLQVLGEFKSYQEALNHEREMHILYDVVASTQFFNKSIACQNTYADPMYATYKHSITGKIARLLRNHQCVLSGEWVGVTSGVKLTEEQKQKKSMPGTKNPFFGKTHTKEVKEKIAEGTSLQWKGKPKTKEQKQKMSYAAKERWRKYHESH